MMPGSISCRDNSLRVRPLYNGNIAGWSWATRTTAGGVAPPDAVAGRYRYDVLNRLRGDSLFTLVSNAWSGNTSNAYGTEYAYDGNGNITSLKRRNETGVEFDNLSYNYQTSPKTNRLLSIDDSYTTTATHPNDLEDQGANNYAYDQIGNLTSDTQEGLSLVVWTPSNKIDSIATAARRIAYTYDATGNRVRKRVWNTSNVLQSTTWYVRDPQGSPLAIYTKATTEDIKLSEVPLYGSDRIGMIKPEVEITMTPFDTIGVGTPIETHRYAAQRFYELKDHLGNVRAVVNDEVQRLSTGEYLPTVVSMTDYYPFGMAIEDRRENQEGYRWGFNGKENDNEVKGDGTQANQQDYGFRIYDPRVARFLSVDPLTKDYPWYTPYQFAGNTPINAVDIDGLEPAYRVPGSPWVHTASDHLQHTPPANAQYLAPSYEIQDPRDLNVTDFVPVLGNFKSLVGATIDFDEGNYVSGTIGLIGAAPGGNYLKNSMRSIGWVSKFLKAEKAIDISAKGLREVLQRAGVQSTQLAVKQGTGKIAIIGEGAKRIEAIKAELGDAVELFDVMKMKGGKEAMFEWNQLVGASSGPLSESVVKETKLYKLNQEWIKGLREEGATVIDIGVDESRAARSKFHEMEVKVTFGSE